MNVRSKASSSTVSHFEPTTSPVRAWNVGLDTTLPIAKAWRRTTFSRVLHTTAAPLPYHDLRSISSMIESPMRIAPTLRAIFTDSHFLIPVVVFCIGLALLILLH
jgi:hypothetical protein